MKRMRSNNGEQKEMQETIEILLKTTEMLKSVVAPLGKGQKHILDVLEQHDMAIGSLMEKLIGTRQDHIDMMKRLELVETNVSLLKEDHGEVLQSKGAFGKVYKGPESRRIDEIVKTMDEGRIISSRDLKSIDRLLLSYPDDAYLLGAKAEALSSLGRKKEALKLLDDAIAKSDNPRLWYTRGLMLTDDFDASMKSFDKSLEQLGDGPKIAKHLVYYARAGLLYRAGKIEKALDEISRSLEMNLGCSAAWTQKGKILLQLRRIPEALGCLEKAIETNPKSSNAWFWRGEATSALGPTYFDQAQSSYDKAIAIDPAFSEAYFNKGVLFNQSLQFKKAIDCFDEGLKINSKDPCAWCDRGVALNRLHKNKDALESFQRALDLSLKEESAHVKDCALIQMDMGIVLYCLKRYKESLNFAKNAVKKNPKNSMFLSFMACCLFRSGKEEHALKTFEKALRLKKDDAEINWKVLVKLYTKMGKTKEAREALKRVRSSEERIQRLVFGKEGELAD